MNFKLNLYAFLIAAALTLPCTAQTVFHRSYNHFKYDYGYDIRQTADTGYIIAGTTVSYTNGANEVLLIKTDSLGEVQWQKSFGQQYNDMGKSIRILPDGGFLISGYTNSYSNNWDVLLARTDEHGDTLWMRSYGGDGWDLGAGAEATADGGFLVAATSYSTGNQYGDVLLIKTNADGDSLWAKTFGTPSEDGVYDFSACGDDHYILGGFSKDTPDGRAAAYYALVNGTGDLLWERTIIDSSAYVIRSIKRSADQGYVAAGEAVHPTSGMSEVLLIKTDSLGDTLWTRTHAASRSAYGLSVCTNPNGGYAVVGPVDYGGKNYRLFLVTDENGNKIASNESGYSYGTQQGNAIINTLDGGYILVGDINSHNDRMSDVLVQKINSSNGGSKFNTIEDHSQTTRMHVTVQPNPVNGEALISIEPSGTLSQNWRFKLYNTTGTCVMERNLLEKTRHFTLSRKGLPAGIYLYAIDDVQNSKGLATGKIVFQD